MKKLSKLLSTALLILVPLLVSACAKETIKSDFIGEWHATKAQYNNLGFNPKEMGIEISIELKDDGTATFVQNKISNSDKWSETETTIQLESLKITFEKRENEISTEFDGKTYIFEKQ